MPNVQALKVYESLTFQELSNAAIVPILRRLDAESRVGLRTVKITDDLQYLVVFPDANEDLEITVYSTDGGVSRRKVDLDRSFTIREVESLNGKLGWLCQGGETVVGSFEDPEAYRIQTTDLAQWDHAGERVLFVPLSLNCDHAANFERPLTLWHYKLNQTNSVRLDFADFQATLAKVLRALPSMKSPRR